MKVKAWVFYHKGCTDGAAAAYAAWEKFGNEAMYTAIDFGDSVIALTKAELMINENIEIYFLDVHPCPYDISKLVEMDHKVYVVDHHKSFYDFHEKISIGAAKSIIKRIGTDVSGSMLAWELFHPDRLVPDVIAYTNDYDTYQFNMGRDSHAYQVMFEQVIGNFDKVIEFAKRPADQVIEEGMLVLAAKLHYTGSIVKNAFDTTLRVNHGNIPVQFCASPRIFRNDVADDLLEGTELHEVVAVCESIEGGKHRISLRTHRNGTNDLDEIAKLYGGGGHHSSAGFVTDNLDMFGFSKPPVKGFWKRFFIKP